MAIAMVTATAMSPRLRPEEVDALPSHKHGHGPARLEYRHNWGVRAGRAAFARHDRVNCFRRVAHMPMYDAWAQGWRLAEEEEWASRKASVSACGGAG